MDLLTLDDITDPFGTPGGWPADDVIVLSMGLLIGTTVLASLVEAVGWAAGVWAVTRQAAGEPVTVSAALAYGVRRAPRSWGWSLLVGLLVAVGLCRCLVPGIYLALAMSLVGLVILVERANPIGRSVRMFHARLTMMLGRLSIVLAVFVGGLLALGEAQRPTRLVLDFLLGFEPFPAEVTSAMLWNLVRLPLYSVLLVALLVTYAEQRCHEAPVNAARLAEELR